MMGRVEIVTRSVRRTRLAVLAPRVVAGVVVGLLCIGGLRAAIAGPPAPAPAPARLAPGADDAARAFAEGFVREYLTWTGDDEERGRRLAPYVGGGLDDDGGLHVAPGTRQDVRWTAVDGERRAPGGRVVVTVLAATSTGQVRLAVPVGRPRRGFVALAGRPALLGTAPVAGDATATTASRDAVDDEQLTVVLERALTNFLSGAQDNLRADLTPDAVVSLPSRRLRVASVGDPAWVVPQRVASVPVEATDARGSTWSLEYELEVRKRDRWYVRSLQPASIP